MTLLAGELIHIGTKLLPFFVSVVLYFLVFIPYDQPSFLGVIVKCLPIINLIVFIKWNGVSKKNRYTYSRRIIAGLLFCCIGDAFLVFSYLFEIGMVAFAIGHVNYILAFGFVPLKLTLGIIIYSLGGVAAAYLYPELTGVLCTGVPIYILVICTMVWRAKAGIQNPPTLLQLLRSVGGMMFAISDLIIALDKFKYPVAYAQVLIMSSYYAAQFGITLSVLTTNTKY